MVFQRIAFSFLFMGILGSLWRWEEGIHEHIFAAHGPELLELFGGFSSSLAVETYIDTSLRRL